MRQVSQAEVDSRGLTVSDTPVERYVEVTDPRTGMPMSMPEGLDPGWDISHRRSERTAYLRQMLAERRRG